MKRWPLLVVLLVACTHADVVPIRGPDGKDGWYGIHCHGFDASPRTCADKASELCPRGWFEIDTGGGETRTLTETQVGSTFVVGAGNTKFDGELFVQCVAGPVGGRARKVSHEACFTCAMEACPDENKACVWSKPCTSAQGAYHDCLGKGTTDKTVCRSPLSAADPKNGSALSACVEANCASKCFTW